MATNQRLIVGIAVVAIIVAVIAIAALLISTNATPGTIVASVPSPTAQQGEDNVRTQVVAEMTMTGQVVAITNQAATLVSMQETLSAQSGSGSTVVPVATAPVAVVTQVVVVTARPTQERQTEQVVWNDESINVQSGSLTLGANEDWVVFQGWDGRSVDTTIHGVIEPGQQVIIPAPFQGTVWTVTGITYEAITERALEMRDEALEQGTAGTAPVLLYVGEEHVPQGYSIQLPQGWRIA